MHKLTITLYIGSKQRVLNVINAVLPMLSRTDDLCEYTIEDATPEEKRAVAEKKKKEQP